METHQFSSYDRAGDNYDWEYFPLYMETNGECVIFDAMGPGCLYRQHMNIWYGRPIYKGINIRYYFDDETTPRIDMDVSTFFSTNNPLGIFQPPLAYNGAKRFRMFYHPMFFKKRLKVCLSAEPGGSGLVSEPWTGSYTNKPNGNGGHWHWYEYTYQSFAEDPGLESWTPDAGRNMMPALIKAWGDSRSTGDAQPVPDSQESTNACTVKPGHTATLWKLNQAGSIAALHINIDPTNDASALFDTWLKITFDGASSPQIEAPLGCFFGAYRTSLRSSYASLLLGYSNNQAYCYFPMPFWKSAVVQLENHGKGKVTAAATVDCLSGSVMPYSQLRCGYLFAHYHREDPRIEGKDYTYLETTGSGQVVGHVVSRWNTSMEEDERTYFDGSRTPWIIGEGFEDDHDMGWGLQNLTQPIFGAISAKGGAGGIYRFLLPDMYCFSSGIKYGHQTYGPHTPMGHEGKYQVGTEESVAFWYGSAHPQLVQTDEVDAGNLRSERKHAYAAEGDVQPVKGKWWYDGEFNNILRKTAAIKDDGVSFTGSSTFTVAISPKNEGVRLRRRCDKANNRQEARVYIDGQLVTERPWYSVDFEKTYRDIRWFDSDFEVPKSYTRGKNKITVRIEFVSSQTGRWDDYHDWVYSYLPAN
ncbi:MAG TPA: DUF2961 domain-containing protein [Candidatus Sulfotelmatobacter sp.]|nr:DUF2961 domain-containing protein [Candidatus Sulfotelmatobacter sp.]